MCITFGCVEFCSVTKLHILYPEAASEGGDGYPPFQGINPVFRNQRGAELLVSLAQAGRRPPVQEFLQAGVPPPSESKRGA